MCEGGCVDHTRHVNVPTFLLRQLNQWTMTQAISTSFMFYNAKAFNGNVSKVTQIDHESDVNAVTAESMHMQWCTTHSSPNDNVLC